MESTKGPKMGRKKFASLLVVPVVAMGILAGPIAPANAWEFVANNRCAGGVQLIPYKVQGLNAGYAAFFSQRRIDRSPCFAGRQIIRVTYREFTGYNVSAWTLQETGPGNNQPAAWYVNANQSLNVPSWEGAHNSKDILWVDVKVEWFTDAWTPLSTMMISHRNTWDYQCLSAYCWIKTNSYVGAYIQYS